MMNYSAYVPCFNNSSSVGEALRSLQAQAPPPAELFLVDDGSTDESRSFAELLGVPVVSMGRNSGRGAVRACSMELASCEYVACCDATNYLPPDYVARALHWFADLRVAAVCGPISQQHPKTQVDRWRGRHLFKISSTMTVQHRSLLSTYGCVVRASAVREVGNFNPNLRHSEDVDLGQRLLNAGFDVIFDPSLCVYSGISNTTQEVLERYWRWYAGPGESVSLVGYARLVWYSLRVMVLHDLRDRDLGSIPITLLCPHYQFWRSWLSRHSPPCVRNSG
jgi:glycosyltransferase involved in cell wall biosynthesis